MCSRVASPPILAVQLAERALTACNYSQNHLLALSVDVIGSASAGGAQHGTCVNPFLQIPWGFLHIPVVLRANFLLACRYCITRALPPTRNPLPLPTHMVQSGDNCRSLVDATFSAGQASHDRCILTPKNETPDTINAVIRESLPVIYMFMSQLIILVKILRPNPKFTQTSS